jgi:hypothetical protein
MIAPMNLRPLKTAAVLMILLVVLSTFAFPQDAVRGTPDRSWRTGFSWNGRFWKGSMPFVKTGFLLGYEQALVTTGAPQFPEYSKFEEFKKQLYPALTMSEIESAVDRFYETPENGPVAVSDALRIIAAKANGGSAEDIEKLTEDSRKSAARMLSIEHRN